MMSSSALRNENAARKKGGVFQCPDEGERKGSPLGLWHGPLSRDLYKEQWLKLLDMSDQIRAFIAANEAQLKAKD
jgi:hypothetical protein